MTIENQMENQSDYTPPGEGKWKFTGYHMIACVVAFFAVIMFANFTMAWFASSSWTGLVVKNSYVASQQFNEKLEAARKQKARGWKVSFSYAGDKVQLQLLGRDGKPVMLDTVKAKFARPVSQSRDTELVLKNIGEGNYQSAVSLAPGVWLFELDGTGAKPYRLEGRLVVSDKGVGRIE